MEAYAIQKNLRRRLATIISCLLQNYIKRMADEFNEAKTRLSEETDVYRLAGKLAI